jgi:hypothetical protein
MIGWRFDPINAALINKDKTTRRANDVRILPSLAECMKLGRPRPGYVPETLRS